MLYKLEHQLLPLFHTTNLHLAFFHQKRVYITRLGTYFPVHKIHSISTTSYFIPKNKNKKKLS